MQSHKKQKRDVSQESSKFEKDVKAVQILNVIKDKYAKQIRVLTSLKREVTQTDHLDQGQKSSLRIQIESILIDLNEEIFAISEELAAAFQGSKTEARADDIFQRAMEFEQKKIMLLSKIKSSITNNPLTKKVKGEMLEESAGRVSHSPPQRESSSNVMRLIKKYSDSKSPISKHNSSMGQGSQKSSLSPYDRRDEVKTSDVSPLRFKQVQHESIETFGGLENSNSPRLKMKLQFQGKQLFDDDLQYKPPQRAKKSPNMPLRNRQGQASSISLSSLPSEAPNITKVRSRKNKSKPLAPSDKRQTQRQISHQANKTKKALNKMYTLDSINARKRSLSRNSRGTKEKSAMIPKYSGCGPGGMNSSLMISHPIKEFKEDPGMKHQSQAFLGMTLNSLDKQTQPLLQNNRGSITANSSRVSSTKKLSSDTKNLNIKQGDKNLRQARKETSELYKAEREASNIAVQKSIEMFKNMRQIEKEESFIKVESQPSEKSFKKPLRQGPKPEKAMSSQDFYQKQAALPKVAPMKMDKAMSSLDTFDFFMRGEEKGSITQTSDAVVQFSKDFDLMRKKFGEMHNEMQYYKKNIQGLNKQVTHLKDDNLKLSTDIKVIRGEHTGMLHTVRKLEEKNQQLVSENLTLKDILYERKVRGFENQIEIDRIHQSEQESLEKQRDPLNPRGRPPASQASLPNYYHNSSINSINSKSRSPSNDGYSRVNQHPLRTKNSLDREKGFTKIIESPFNNALHKLSSDANDSKQEDRLKSYIPPQKPQDPMSHDYNSGRDDVFTGKFPSKSDSHLTSQQMSHQQSMIRHQTQSQHQDSLQFPDKISYIDERMEPVIQSDDKATKYISYVHTTLSQNQREMAEERPKPRAEVSPDGKLSDWVVERINRAKNRY